MRLFIVILIISLFNLDSTAQDGLFELHINQGEFLAVDSVTFPYLSYNTGPEFQQESVVLHAKPGDNTTIIVQNNDTLEHGFKVKGIEGSELVLQPGARDSISLALEEGVYIYYDPTDYPTNYYLGLSGIINVSESIEHTFYWNLSEHQSDWNRLLIDEQSVNWQKYSPEYFTINGRSNPHTLSDTLARVEGSVGDTLKIVIANTGRAVHSIHFHGYHLKITYSSKSHFEVGRFKDTFPIYPAETMLLQLIPHQAGEYPVHDHNLVAVSGGGFYPNGMFITIKIEEE